MAIGELGITGKFINLFFLFYLGLFKLAIRKHELTFLIQWVEVFVRPPVKKVRVLLKRNGFYRPVKSFIIKVDAFLGSHRSNQRVQVLIVWLLGELKISAVFHVQKDLVRTALAKGLMLHLNFLLFDHPVFFSSRN